MSRFREPGPRTDLTGAAPKIANVEDLHVEVPAAGSAVALLAGVSLDVSRGEVVGVVGPSGAGKSTLLRALIGRFPARCATSGRVLLGPFGVAASGDAIDVVARPAALESTLGRIIAYVPQAGLPALDPLFTVGAQFVEALRVAGPVRTAEAWDRAAAALEGLALSPDLLRRHPHQVSGGQRQRLAVALALLHRPELVLADEPASGLDPRAAAHTYEALARARGDAALVLTSHSPLTLGQFADRVAVLDRGRIVEDVARSTGGVLTPHASRSVALVSAEIVRRQHGRRQPVRSGEASWRVRMEDVDIAYPGANEPVIREVSLSVAPGEAVALLGRSGSGKTTLLRVLAGAVPLSRGRLSVRMDADDVAVVARGMRRSARIAALSRAVGFVPQEPHGALDPRLTVEQAFVHAFRRTLHDALWRTPARADILSRAREGLSSVALDPDGFLHKTPRQLSGGEAQRIVLARALAVGAGVLLLDEPTSALDPETTVAAADLLLALRADRGLTIIVATHDVGFALRVAERMYSVSPEGRVHERSRRALDAPCKDGVVDAYVAGYRVGRRAWSLAPERSAR